MKHIYSILFYMISLTSCLTLEDEAIPETEQTDTLGMLEINVSIDGGKTRSTESCSYESGIYSLQYLAFNSTGNIMAYKCLSSTETNTSMQLKYGYIQVYVVANLPVSLRSVKTLSELKATTISLGQNTLNTNGGFIMCGNTSTLVAKDATKSITINLVRLLSRIHVRNVTNSCPSVLGDIFLKSVFLANVVGNQNIAGTAAPSTWYNQCGCRGGIEGQDIDGVTFTAEVPVMTYRSINKTIALGETENIDAYVYGFQNTYTSTSTEFPFNERASRLYFIFSQKNLETEEYEDITCSIALENSMIANSSYAVDINIYGTISDPALQVALEVSSNNVTGWSSIAGDSLNI